MLKTAKKENVFSALPLYPKVELLELGWCGTLFGGPGPDPGNQDRSFDRTTQGPGSLGPGPQFPRDRPQDHSRGPDGWE